MCVTRREPSRRRPHCGSLFDGTGKRAEGVRGRGDSSLPKLIPGAGEALGLQHDGDQVGWAGLVAVDEQNVGLGRANRTLARFGVDVLGTFPGTAELVATKHFVLTGCPVRREILETHREGARRELELPATARVCLVIGGSNGAAALNEAALAMAQRVVDSPDVLVLHVTGRRYYDEMRRRREVEVPAAVDDRYRLVPYADEVAVYYASADVVVSRSGSSTVNELLTAGRAAVLVPSPNVAEDHQAANARFVVSQGAAASAEGEDATTVADEAWALLEQPERRRAMERAALACATGATARDAIRTYVAHRVGEDRQGPTAGPFRTWATIPGWPRRQVHGP